MSLDMMTVILHARALRRAANIREVDPDEAWAETNAHQAFHRITQGMGRQASPDIEIAPLWRGLGEMARRLEIAAMDAAKAREGTFDQVGASLSVGVAYGAVATLMGYRTDALARTINDNTAMSAVEQTQVQDAAE